jgi:phosphate transport system ATP-binding protein
VTAATPNAAPPGAPPAVDAGRLEVRDLSVWFGARAALDRVTLAVPPRAVTALVGPSGGGKSTLLRAVNRLVELTPGVRREGAVLLGGADVYAPGVDAAALRQRVGMVFPRPAVFRASVYDNVAYGARLAGAEPGAELDALVELSLRRAALWDEVRDRLRASALALSGGSSSGCASPARSPRSPRCSSSTSPPRRSTRARRSASRSCSTRCATR